MSHRDTHIAAMPSDRSVALRNFCTGFLAGVLVMSLVLAAVVGMLRAVCAT